MRYIHHLIDDTKFRFVSDLDEIGHFEIIDSQSTIFEDRDQDAFLAMSFLSFGIPSRDP